MDPVIPVNIPTPIYQKISEEGEAEYLDNGGCLSVDRRDHYFAMAMLELRMAESLLRRFRSLEGTKDKMALIQLIGDIDKWLKRS